MKNENLKKLAVKMAGLTAAAAMTLTPMLALADTADSALVQGGTLNLRETASLSARVLGQYPTGTLVEIQGTGEGATFPRSTLDKMLDAALAACETLFAVQRDALALPYPGVLPEGPPPKKAFGS